jgi:uncharacterized membrane protein
MCCEAGVKNKCIPYSDACPITAQVFAAVAFGLIYAGMYFFFWGSVVALTYTVDENGNITADDNAVDNLIIMNAMYWVAALLTFVAFIMSMSSCCCALNKCGFVAIAVLGLLGGIIVIVVTIIVIAKVQEWKDACDKGNFAWTAYTDDIYTDDTYTSTFDCNVDGSGAIYGCSIAGAVFAFVSAVLFIAFACSSRLQTAIDKLKEEQGAQGQQQAVAVAQPGAAKPY